MSRNQGAHALWLLIAALAALRLAGPALEFAPALIFTWSATASSELPPAGTAAGTAARFLVALAEGQIEDAQALVVDGENSLLQAAEFVFYTTDLFAECERAELRGDGRSGVFLVKFDSPRLPAIEVRLYPVLPEGWRVWSHALLDSGGMLSQRYVSGTMSQSGGEELDPVALAALRARIHPAEVTTSVLRQLHSIVPWARRLAPRIAVQWWKLREPSKRWGDRPGLSNQNWPLEGSPRVSFMIYLIGSGVRSGAAREINLADLENPGATSASRDQALRRLLSGPCDEETVTRLRSVRGNSPDASVDAALEALADFPTSGDMEGLVESVLLSHELLAEAVIGSRDKAAMRTYQQSVQRALGPLYAERHLPEPDWLAVLPTSSRKGRGELAPPAQGWFAKRAARFDELLREQGRK